MKTKVAYLGGEGSYSFLAAQKMIKTDGIFVGKETFSDIIKDIEKGSQDVGILPIENSITGSISQVYDLLLHANVQITEEGILKLRHLLLALTGTKQTDLSICYCHPEALKQCQKELGKRKVKLIFEKDTASAVRRLKSDVSGKGCALGNAYLAEKFSLDIIADNIQDRTENFTRFIKIIKKHKEEKLTGEKVTIMFKVLHKPGSLLKALEPYARHGLNLTKIESRPLDEKEWEYIFVVDFLVKNAQDIKKVIKDMRKNTQYLKILGTYPKGKIYEA